MGTRLMRVWANSCYGSLVLHHMTSHHHYMFALKVNAEVKGQMSDGLQGKQHLLVELGEDLHLGGQGEEPKGTVVLAQCVWEKTRGHGHKNMYTVDANL